MSDRRLSGYAQVRWWPSPAHAALALFIASDTYNGPDPSAPEERLIRVRTTQIELSEALNVDPRTVRTVMRDFVDMDIMVIGNGGRTWYLRQGADDPVRLQSRMMNEWPRLHPGPKRRRRSGEDDGAEALEPAQAAPFDGINEPDEYATEVAEIQWYEPDPPQLEVPDPRSAYLKDVRNGPAVATLERPVQREPRDGYPHEWEDWEHIRKWLLLSPPYNHVWWERVLRHFEWEESDAFEAYQQWHLVFASSDPSVDNPLRWAAQLRQAVPAGTS